MSCKIDLGKGWSLGGDSMNVTLEHTFVVTSGRHKGNVTRSVEGYYRDVKHAIMALAERKAFGKRDFSTLNEVIAHYDEMVALVEAAADRIEAVVGKAGEVRHPGLRTPECELSVDDSETLTDVDL